MRVRVWSQNPIVKVKCIGCALKFPTLRRQTGTWDSCHRAYCKWWASGQWGSPASKWPKWYATKREPTLTCGLHMHIHTDVSVYMKKIDLQYTVVSWYHGLWYWAGLLPQLDAQAYFLKQIFAYILLGISSHACRLHQGKHCIIIYSIIQGELSGKCELMFQIVVIFFMTFSIPAGWVCRCREHVGCSSIWWISHMVGDSGRREWYNFKIGN